MNMYIYFHISSVLQLYQILFGLLFENILNGKDIDRKYDARNNTI